MTGSTSSSCSMERAEVSTESEHGIWRSLSLLHWEQIDGEVDTP